MSTIIQAKMLNREGMATQFVNAGRLELDELRLPELIDLRIPDRGAVVGKWRRDGDPFPDILIVRDADLSDTHAWLSSFFSALSPISQWCRIVSQSDVAKLATRNERPILDGRLGGWIGLVLAECSAQAGQSLNLKDLPGTAALASSTYAAARGVAVWGDRCDLKEIAARHDELSAKLREGNRPISAAQLVPIWQALTGYVDPLDKNIDRRRALAPFVALFDKILRQNSLSADSIADVVAIAMDHFRVPQLADCSRGPQLERVRALDQLAQELARNGKAIAADALIGFAASLIDPGMGVLPDLLRKYSGRFPMAPLWLGAFAGCWSSNRALTDHGGLGRLIAKALLVESDLEEKPQCDISYDELSRWLNGVTASKLPLRGMAARSLSVEIYLGVTCPFAIGRADQIKSDTSAQNRREDQGLTVTESQRAKLAASSTQQVAFLARSLDAITKRVDSLEKYIAADIELKRKIAADGSQRDLLSGLPSGEDKNMSTRKK
ncbi:MULTISPECIES: hypothetical protein [unclassified Bradyrhizobium]|uniref:hypothetical protein n=1 Tax=unclassified Bradyrhizobium TaxID=2631580 RepID=UPI001BAACED7|nr:MULTISPECIES: hypothetical protein [unclassified Bradyrhizobium]MBR1203307.1 hypothetical protein [Bradyrhizobium sp. AUGA SZCCT0124]MBR1312970.1 hypothetical protein [Bradyrhizobium sp. AUGA SZCCT0051]MBR1341328.1 hypothetical protein [Bradyrhizobium sp. AUGA SZCCT0105]MBR1356734.1 hypothetical protein [Bradyrhizobium sp. AUGA SZCCT0045]